MQETGVIVDVIKRCNEIFRTRTAMEWRDYFRANNVACEVMMKSHEVSSDPQAIENGYMVPVEYPDADHTTVMMPNPPIWFSDYDRKEYQPTGTIGADTEEILTSMGYSPEEIQAMKDSGAVR